MTQPLLAEIEGKYEILGRLRSGGMGMLYRVRHRLLDEERVVKVLHARHGRDATLRERFVREARAAIRLRHPNVVQVHDFSLDSSGAGLIVMERIDGIDLKRMVDLHLAPSIPLGLEIARQSLRALGYLHRNDFVHRDVSPDNLMLALDVDGRPHVTLIDLGIARPKDGEALTLTGSFLGKLRYASPEHLERRGSGGSEDGIEARSDLYALGIVLFELFTGRHPFPASSPSELIAAQLRRPPLGWQEADPEGRLPAAARTMLERALEKRPDARWPSADAWIEAVEELQRLHPLDGDAVAEARRAIDVVRERTGAGSSSGVRPAVAPGKVLPGNLVKLEPPRPAELPQGRLDATFPVAEPTPAPRAPERPPDDEFDRIFSDGVKAVLLRDYPTARRLFERALALRPDDPRLLFNLERLRSRS